MRRRSRIEDKLEKLSVGDALEAIRFAEVVILLMDAKRPSRSRICGIADLVEREGRALVIGVNKWDLKDDPARCGRLREEADDCCPGQRRAGGRVSGLTGTASIA